ncbi:MAG: DNA polymerase III subunit delta' [Firmicutes bacterium]|nr:DNA polymerase III subunit delta' [Bacillota bacterium]
MMWENIYGRNQLVRTLQSAISSGKIAHAYLFYGPGGIGKKTIAQVLATALNCVDVSTSACGQCSSCRKAQNGTHPDIHWIVPEGKSLKIDQIRNVKKHAYLKPRESRYQIFILEQADSMTAQAANSLLKVLEEPPAGSVFILLANHPATLPATVSSRCQLFAVDRLDPVDMTLLLEIQSNETPADVAEIIEWAEGIPGRALTLLDKATWRAQYAQAALILTDIVTVGGVSETAAKVSQLKDVTAFLDTLTLVLRDILMSHVIADAVSKDRRALIMPLTASWSRDACLVALQTILLLQKQLQSPVNTRLALEKALRCLKEGI